MEGGVKLTNITDRITNNPIQTLRLEVIHQIQNGDMDFKTSRQMRKTLIKRFKADVSERHYERRRLVQYRMGGWFGPKESKFDDREDTNYGKLDGPKPNKRLREPSPIHDVYEVA